MKLPKEVSIQEIAMLIGGKVQSTDNVKVHTISLKPLTAQEGEVAFLFDPKIIAQMDQCNASILILPTGTKCQKPCVYVDRPLLAIQKVLQFFQPKRYFPDTGVHPTAIVDPTCEIGKDVAIGPYVVIGPKTKIGDRTRIMAHCVIGGEVQIGENSLLYPSCLIADYVKIGNKVVLQQGAVLGSDGFAYVTAKPNNMERRMSGNFDLVDESNPHLKIAQIGTVIIEDEVEIGSCTTIDRATMGATVIGKGTKIDNQVMIAHNCKIGQEVLVVAQVAIGGSCTVGDRCVLAGQASLSDHIELGKDAIVSGTSGAMRDVEAGGVVTGTPALPHREFMKNIANTRRLPKMHDEIKGLKKRVAELEKLLSRSAELVR
jgi:UDP-3-O-[3-hydroxymyristoyl] glucosamine N-acyltransferase